jgi:hypothetical protein
VQSCYTLSLTKSPSPKTDFIPTAHHTWWHSKAHGRLVSTRACSTKATPATAAPGIRYASKNMPALASTWLYLGEPPPKLTPAHTHQPTSCENACCNGQSNTPTPGLLCRRHHRCDSKPCCIRCTQKRCCCCCCRRKNTTPNCDTPTAHNQNMLLSPSGFSRPLLQVSGV